MTSFTNDIFPVLDSNDLHRHAKYARQNKMKNFTQKIREDYACKDFTTIIS